MKAREIARAVANSILVKTAVYGRDPNWGRIAAAGQPPPLRWKTPPPGGEAGEEVP